MTAKLILMSVILATAIVPAITASDPMPRRGLARAVTAMLVFNVLYLLALIFVYPRFS